MASNGTISIGFRIEAGKDGLQNLIVDAQGLRRALNANVTESERLSERLINFAALATGIDSVSKTLNDITSVVNDLSGAYDVQNEVENQLAQVMRNTMGAREDDIQSIKDFCSAQQQIGIVGDEVQLAGAQELATYLELKTSLKTLIPVMNDMLAQQYGFAASGENASQIATMLGKVMDGQTGALSRYGYKFDEAQEKILKTGTEMERAAVLAEVVGESVGGMNRRLAQTDSGRMKQLENALGDVKEQLGAVVKGWQPILTMAAEATIAAGGVLKLVSSIKAAAAAMRVFAISSGPVGIALTALATVMGIVAVKSGFLTGETERLTDAQKRQQEAAQRAADVTEIEEDAHKQASSAIETHKAKLKELLERKSVNAKEEKAMVEELNRTYGSTMGYFAKLSDWYDALIKNSKAYCDQMVAEAKTRKLADQIADLELQRRAIVRNPDGTQRTYSDKHETKVEYVPPTEEEKKLAREARKGSGASPYNRYSSGGTSQGSSRYRTVQLPSERDKAQADYDAKTAEINALRGELEKTAGEKGKIVMPMRGAEEEPDLTDKKPGKTPVEREPQKRTRLQEISAEMSQVQEEYLSLRQAQGPEDSKDSNDSSTRKEELRSRMESLRQEKSAVELSLAELERPLKLDSLEAYDREIAYQMKRRDTASESELEDIDKEIERLKLKRSVFEGVEKEQEPRVAATPEEATTIEEMTTAIDALDKKIQTSSVEEIADLQRTKMAFEAKKEAYERGITIPQMEAEADEILNLSDKEMKVKVRGMGFEELSGKISEIDRMLNDLDNPPTEGQRKSLEELRGHYEDWRRTCVMSFSTVSDGWETLSGIGGAVESLTEMLQGNRSAWQSITTAIDSVIQLYEGIQSVISIMEMIGIISRVNAAAKEEETVATVASTAATAADAAVEAGTTAAKAPVIAVNKLATASYMELAAAEYFAAHASIPLAGFGIATGFTTAATALVQGIGAMPFADGGVVYGPTLGLVGEYAGARSNPEVIAPLDKLQDIIGGTGGQTVVVGGEFRLRGRDMVAVLANETRVTAKSGKRTNIKI